LILALLPLRRRRHFFRRSTAAESTALRLNARAVFMPEAVTGSKSDPASLWRTTAIMRNRRNVPDKSNLNTRRLDGAYGRFATRAGTFHPYLARVHAKLAGCLRIG